MSSFPPWPAWTSIRTRAKSSGIGAVDVGFDLSPATYQPLSDLWGGKGVLMLSAPEGSSVTWDNEASI